jgi:Undecaprenyl-phosphate galactose phosphotransferase WbaP
MGINTGKPDTGHRALLPGTSSERSITAILVISDLAAIVVSFLVSFFIRKNIPFLSPLAHGLDVYVDVWPAIFLWPLVFWREGLYPGIWLSVRDELRLSVTGTSIASILAMAVTFLTQTGLIFSRPIIVGGWLVSILLVPAFRYVSRRLMSKAGISGPRTVILGAGLTAAMFMDSIKQKHPPSLNPVALFDDDVKKQGTTLGGVSVVGPIDQAQGWASAEGIRYAIVAMPGVPHEVLAGIIERQAKTFSRFIVIPDLFGISAANVDTHEISGILALELRRSLLYRRNRIAKRLIDLFILLLGMVFIFPLTILIGLAILIDAGRPAFFKHERIGRGGKPFMAWKYRTMEKDAEGALQEAFLVDPDLNAEWDERRKLRRDPRLTRTGRIIRRLSLDELPQVWNVLKGDMSLVGPRPIVREEIEKYGENIVLYEQVLPGLTGLWQVSGRSDLPYDKRVWLDTQYVRNWSVWLDIVILVRTIGVVISGEGAY